LQVFYPSPAGSGEPGFRFLNGLSSLRSSQTHTKWNPLFHFVLSHVCTCVCRTLASSFLYCTLAHLGQPKRSRQAILDQHARAPGPAVDDRTRKSPAERRTPPTILRSAAHVERPEHQVVRARRWYQPGPSRIGQIAKPFDFSSRRRSERIPPEHISVHQGPGRRSHTIHPEDLSSSTSHIQLFPLSLVKKVRHISISTQPTLLLVIILVVVISSPMEPHEESPRAADARRCGTPVGTRWVDRYSRAPSAGIPRVDRGAAPTAIRQIDPYSIDPSSSRGNSREKSRADVFRIVRPSGSGKAPRA